jgi:Fe-S-cluster-containing hydrogenase component 2
MIGRIHIRDSCMDICPAQALTMQDKHIIIDVQECIRCYCCHEVCPASAILVEEN